MPDLERRNLSAGLVTRAADGSVTQIVGHAAVFNTLSVDLGGFYEMMHVGAFTRTIQEDDIRAFWNHDINWVLGRNKSGTLRLEEDAQGLAIENDPPNAQWARDLIASIERGDVDQMSIGFWVLRDEWVQEGPMIVRHVYEVKLFDVSPVTAAAYVQTDVGVRVNELAEISTRIRSGAASPAELKRLSEMLDVLNKRGNQAEPAGDARGRAGLDLRQRLLKMLSGKE